MDDGFTPVVPYPCTVYVLTVVYNKHEGMDIYHTTYSWGAHTSIR